MGLHSRVLRAPNTPYYQLQDNNIMSGEAEGLLPTTSGPGPEDSKPIRPVGAILGVLFGLFGIALTLLGVIVWVVLTPLSFICPGVACFEGAITLAVCLIQVPVSIAQFTADNFP